MIGTRNNSMILYKLVRLLIKHVEYEMSVEHPQASPQMATMSRL